MATLIAVLTATGLARISMQQIRSSTRPRSTLQGVCQANVVIAQNQGNLVNAYAYQGCTTMKTLSFHSSIEFIGAYAFDGCSQLKTVTWPSSLKTIKTWAFRGCSSLTSVVLPSRVETIESYAFYDATSLTSIVFPTSLSEVGEAVFKGDVNVVMSFAADGGVAKFAVRSSGKMLFAEGYTTLLIAIESVTQLDLPIQTKVLGIYCCWNTRIGPNIVLSGGLERLEHDCFNGCSGIKSVTVGKAMSYIDQMAFRDNPGIEKFDVDEANAHFTSRDGVLFNKALTILLMYPSGKTGEQIRLPANLRSFASLALETWCPIKKFILEGHNYLELDSTSQILFTKGRKELVRAVPTFAGSYVIPKTVKTLQGGAFASCRLTSIKITSKSVTSIGEYCFYRCIFPSIDLEGVSSIGVFAFHASSLTSVVIVGSISMVSENCFSYSQLQSVTMSFGVEVIGECSFRRCGNLKTVKFPESITSIGTSAFEIAPIQALKLPRTVLSTIGVGAFESCAIRGEIRIPFCVKIVKTEAFSTCYKAESAIIENCETIVEADAFRAIYDRVNPYCITTKRFTALKARKSIDKPGFKFNLLVINALE